jgi:hypothetical protein
MTGWLDELRADARYAGRQLLATPTFTLVAALAAVYRQVQADLPGESQVRRAVPVTLLSQLVGDVRQRLLVLLGAVTFVLLLACANVAHLLLARGGIRAHEIAIRGALGAKRSRIVRQLLTEALALALVGGILGIVAAYGAIPLLVTMSPAGVPRLDEASVDARVLAFALLASLVSAAIAGLAPAMVTTRADLRSAISEGGRNASLSRERLRFVLIAAEVALALVLLTGAGLLVRSALRLQEVDPGFDARGVLSARITLPATGYEQGEKVVGPSMRSSVPCQRRPASRPRPSHRARRWRTKATATGCCRKETRTTRTTSSSHSCRSSAATTSASCASRCSRDAALRTPIGETPRS